MKRIFIMLILSVLTVYGEIYTDEVYTCSSEHNLTVRLEIIDGGSIAILNDTLMFHIKHGLYAGVSFNNDKLYVVVHKEANLIRVGSDVTKPIICQCKSE